eukprot:CAMPEP_0113279936 /NCGR_PEP_ID=MMETSP0008_2-20120614/27463_1 /TAXON_ID=97485 /ORGANISM="Prymnesium parvum" /LENGTH=39 /DNA_ID=CAMNT_0000130179 /DNA_START=130 /DNA_END=246 /DNA_ORIENTATION=+ /assembly_acc=CAM_ASM_000153
MHKRPHAHTAAAGAAVFAACCSGVHVFIEKAWMAGISSA